jgi:hypothetical protein
MSTHIGWKELIIKLIDFDYFNNVEPLCKRKLVAKCEYNITCYRPKNSGNVPCGPGTRCRKWVLLKSPMRNEPSGEFSRYSKRSARSNTYLIRCSTDKDNVVTLKISPNSYTAVIPILLGINLMLFSWKGFTQKFRSKQYEIDGANLRRPMLESLMAKKSLLNTFIRTHLRKRKATNWDNFCLWKKFLCWINTLLYR